MDYCKRLIEVDLPIRRISENARLEKEKRRSHVPLLYIWPATRPTSACRAIICASIFPDPVDETCPQQFRDSLKNELTKWSEKYLGLLSSESYKDFVRYKDKPELLDDPMELRKGLLHFIADFSDNDNSNKNEFSETARNLTLVSHEVLGGEKGSKPLLVDPFAGGGAIPLEALRVGCDAFAGDLNSVAVFYNKVLLEILPRYGEQLTDEINKWFEWIKKEVKPELKEFYPNDKDGLIPIAYLWARTIKCEGPGCGAEIPLIRSLRLTRKTKAIKLIVDKHKKTINFEIIQDATKTSIPEGTMRRGSAICPCCGYTTHAKSVRKQLGERRGGTDDSRLFCVVLISKDSKGRYFRVSTSSDLEVFKKAKNKLLELKDQHVGSLSLTPNEPLPIPSSGRSGTIGIGLQGYGIKNWGDLFNSRQLLTHLTYIRLSKEYLQTISDKDKEFKDALASIICLVINRLIDLNASLCVWQLNTPNTAHVFGRWALSIVMDFGEINPLAGAGGSIDSVMRRVTSGIKNNSGNLRNRGTAQQSSATNIALPNDAADYFVTDPPYYDAIPYSDLSNFFYVWMKRIIGDRFTDLFRDLLTDRVHECIMDNDSGKDKAYFEKEMEKALSEGRRVLKPNGVGLVIFAHKSTSGWESLLQAILNAGWIFTASWPIDTEMQSRLRAKNSATLSSSVHLVCRPRENLDGLVTTDHIGDWRDVLQELPKKIHDWMPRLAAEGVVGADAIFACLGPAFEIFSKYSHVEKANGEKVELKEYLEQVWGAVAKEALNMIFEGGRTEGFEEDARLTAMWLWTLFAGASENGKKSANENGEITDENEAGSGKAILSGFSLEFDAARKIAQGLGAHLENLTSVIEIEGDQARLLSVAERVKILFGKDSSTTATYKRKKKDNQMTLFPELEEIKENEWSLGDSKASLGKTILDRLHQAMILFGAGRAEALRRFLVEEGVGKDDRFWRLAQALSALYPTSTDEKCWIDGVLAKKKSSGF